MAQETGLDQALLRTCGQDPKGVSTLACKDACALAAQFAMPVEAFGRLCNERGIKIVHCRLGCFA
jgi:hypothetical protein